jgi:threonine aldolase
MDGARFANAVAELGVSPAALTWQAGVDLLCFGGTKQGMPGTEAIVIFNPEVGQHFEYSRKQAGQLASKMRVLAAPWIGMLTDGAWLRHAAHANAAAQSLAQALAALPRVEVLTPVHGNAVFVALPEGAAAALHARGWHFYPFTPTHHRLMCSWATTQTEIDALVADLAQEIGDQR